jgi:hypothetical protein
MRAETISRCVNSAVMSKDAAFNVLALVFGAALPIALLIAVLFYVAECHSATLRRLTSAIQAIKAARAAALGKLLNRFASANESVMSL